MATICEWFALCDHDAIGTIDHVALGTVPICARCANRMEYADRVRPFDNHNHKEQHNQ